MGVLHPDAFKLTDADKQHFLEHGYIKVSGCFPPEAAEEFTANLWTRLGMSPTDKSTWTKERTNMPYHTHTLAADFAPKAWSAICQLLAPEDGGEQEGDERISGGDDDKWRSWSDGFIVNLGTPESEKKDIDNMDEDARLRNAGVWHVDGDFFVHYLDSPEQALLVIPLFTDIQSKGGATYENPAGLTPWFKPTDDATETREFFEALSADKDKLPTSSLVEATGKIGDVYLMHPLTLHSASENLLRIPRVITNPPVVLREPFNFDREDGRYSLVERKTLRELGMEGGLKGWAIEGGRRGWVSERMKRMEGGTEGGEGRGWGGKGELEWVVIVLVRKEKLVFTAVEEDTAN
ncbi:Clavaminate synthase-like protein [Glarea lozoyensis ATCC 20868]|uniref:Clavaminate synthase-like protein n=1 Tax=Glarea lozoyensis (strain ATCC 20868 / MF5171) TaxID=1116229 RepID=S3CJS7_GLAL2|nr:Clavaminate synthase-like protein [Glarea lozoyensis ATCC 20868]EPE25489.1 Clavaminate synthase-like protein [Glarea lozoyensis ATCC 20868]